MKQCPVCNESFADEFSFCDLDGAELDGGAKSSAASGPSGGAGKLWPIVGVVLVLCAVATVVASIVFFPRALSAPPLSQGQPSISVKTNAGSSSSDNTQTQTASTLPPSDSQDEQDASKSGKAALPSDSNLAALSKSAKKNGVARDQNPPDGDLDPKSAVKPAAEIEPVDGSGDHVPRSVNVPANGPEVKPTVAKGGTGASGGATTAGGASTSTTSTVKKRTARTDAGDSGDGSMSRNTKKKKGGFLKIFKKIFGQG